MADKIKQWIPFTDNIVMLAMTGVHKLGMPQTIRPVSTDISVLKTLETMVMKIGITTTISTQIWETMTDTITTSFKSFGDWV